MVSRFLIMVSALVVIGVGITYLRPAAPLRKWDLSVSRSLAASRSDDLESAATFISRAGDTLPIVTIAALIAIGLAFAHRWQAMALIPVALLVEVATFGAVNYTVRRPRPDVDTVGSVPSTFSFPSGHVAATLVCWLGLAILLHGWRRRRAAVVLGAFGVLAAGAMGWARLYLGMHFLLDVVFGLVMGVGSVYVAATAFRVAFIRSRSGASAGVFPDAAATATRPAVPPSGWMATNR